MTSAQLVTSTKTLFPHKDMKIHRFQGLEPDIFLYVHVCMCTYVYACMCVPVPTCAHVCRHMHSHACVCLVMEARWQPWVWFLRNYPLCFLRPKLADEEPSELFCFWLPCSGIIDATPCLVFVFKTGPHVCKRREHFITWTLSGLNIFLGNNF